MAFSHTAKPATAETVNGPRNINLLSERIDANSNASRVRLQYLASRLHALGPRPLFEFLKEIADGAEPLPRLEAYAQLDPGIIRALGGDILPIDRMTVLSGGRS